MSVNKPPIMSKFVENAVTRHGRPRRAAIFSACVPVDP